MLNLNSYRDSTYGLLLPSAMTFACLGTSDHQVRRFRDAQLLQEGTDLIRMSNQGVTRIFYTLAGLQKLCNLLLGQAADALQQTLTQLFPQPPLAQLPAIAQSVGAGGAMVNLAPPFTVAEPQLFMHPFAAATVPESVDFVDPLLPAHTFVPQPQGTPTWEQMEASQHPVVGAILQGRGYANAHEVVTQMEMLLAQQALMNGGTAKTEAETLLAAQRLMAESISRSQEQTTGAIAQVAQ